MLARGVKLCFVLRLKPAHHGLCGVAVFKVVELVAC